MTSQHWSRQWLDARHMISYYLLPEPMMSYFYDAYLCHQALKSFNTLRSRQNGHLFTSDILKCIFLNEIVWILIEISLTFIPKGPINYIPALVQMMAWRRTGDKPLSEPMMVNLLMHIYVTWPEGANEITRESFLLSFAYLKPLIIKKVF